MKLGLRFRVPIFKIPVPKIRPDFGSIFMNWNWQVLPTKASTCPTLIKNNLMPFFYRRLLSDIKCTSNTIMQSKSKNLKFWLFQIHQTINNFHERIDKILMSIKTVYGN
jgi:hypothetical protein